MLIETPRCGCATCAGANTLHFVDKPSAASNTQANAVQASVIGTASEAVTDGTPTNGKNPWIDSLVWGGKWVDTPGLSTAGGAVSISVAFQSGSGAYDWDSDSLVAVVEGLLAWARVANIDFIAASSASSADSWFWLGTNSQAGGTNIGGRSEVPGYSTGEPLYTLFNRDFPTWFSSNWGFEGIAVGGYGYLIIIHEIGHLLGLAHPHDGGNASDGTIFPGVTSEGDFGDYNLNQGIFTTMSYNAGWQSQYPNHTLAVSTLGFGWQATPMALDIAAIQAIYGANTTYASESDSYALPIVNAAGTYWSCIWDTGGTDLITNDGSSLACTIDLRAASLDGKKDGIKAGGYVSYATNIVGGYTIANGVVIENATGGSGNDTINGNAAANSLIGGAGNDSIDGGAGNDTIDGGEGSSDRIIFSGKYSAYQIQKSGDTYTVSTSSTPDGTDTVTNVESFQFSDGTKSVDNLIPNTAPVFQTAAVSTDGTKIVLTYSETLGSTVAPAAAFIVSANKTAFAVTSVAASDATIELTLASTINNSHAVTVAYKPPKADAGTSNQAIQDSAGLDAIGIKSATVTNNSTVAGPDLTAPVFQSAAVSSDGTKIVLTYSEALGATVAIAKAFTITVAKKPLVVSSVAASGSTIELSLASTIKSGQAVILAYKAPKSDAGTSNLAIQDSLGNDAVSLSKISVTNASTASRVLSSTPAEFSSEKLPAVLAEFNEAAEHHTVMVDLVGHGINHEPWVG